MHSTTFRPFRPGRGNRIGRRRLAALLASLLLPAAAHAADLADGGTGHAGRLTASGPVVVRGQSDVVIRDVRISNPSGPCILIEDSADVRVHNTRLGPCGAEAIRAKRADGLVVTRNTIGRSAKGVYALSSRRVRVVANEFVGVTRNLVQFDKVSGPDNYIVRNVGDLPPGNAVTEDLISLYLSDGTAKSPIKVLRNRLRGGGESASGSGILLGDNGGSHQVAACNTLVDPGQVGIGVASGTNIEVLRNRLFQSARPWSNAALYVWNQAPGEDCRNVRVVGNEVTWRKADGQPYPWWNGGGCSAVRREANDFDAGLTAGVFGD